MTHRAFVGKHGAATQHRLDVGAFGEAEWGGDAFQSFLAQADGQQHDFADETLVLGEEEGELGHLDG